ncbi:hypothetical protein [endosymbiont of Lamellibrachia barhami]|uniref:hypothetical protein n=1 Tax=endosymbiont of Lamellibrachia barhami TaxID=205975 RepID=UPI0015A8DABE|nr:hypothetical protein [endosymbiont of Lamellibrachia barhami]
MLNSTGCFAPETSEGSLGTSGSMNIFFDHASPSPTWSSARAITEPRDPVDTQHAHATAEAAGQKVRCSSVFCPVRHSADSVSLN